MPCEGCYREFTVFKRKHSCYDCKRYYCHKCLANNNVNKHALCVRCLLFSKRPLVRSDLIKLKPKDLIFYLQSKHISTAGCVEKEELIDLVLQYVNRADMNNQLLSDGSGGSSRSSSHHATPQHNIDGNDAVNGVGGASQRPVENSTNASNSFDSIKQTCQNFLSSLSDNISDSLANFESRACSKNRPSTTMTSSTNVTEQPRVTTRVIPTYASSQQSSPENPITSPIEGRGVSSEACFTMENLVVNLPSSSQIAEENKNEECNCSDDDEIIASFNSRSRSPKSDIESQDNLKGEQDSVNGTNTNSDINTTNNCAPSTSSNTSRHLSQNSKLEIYVNEEESSHSSFEELGAIGGISDDSKTTTDTTSNTTDQWQMLDLKNNETDTALSNLSGHQRVIQSEVNIDKSIDVQSNDSSENKSPIIENHKDNQEYTNQPPPTPTHVHPTPRVKKVTRRRSESYLNRKRLQNSVDDDNDVYHLQQGQQNRIEEECQTSRITTKPTPKRCCVRCGKNKANIRQQVEKMRQHLESSQMSEIDIKKELSEFLVYLEQRTKSIEYSDSEAGVSTGSISRHTNEIDGIEEVSMERQLDEQAVNRYPVTYNENIDKADVSSYSFYDKESRFINLDDIDSIKQLECLTVKQLKEILMLHRVDYKGCCEKQELLDRVERLWKNLKSTPAVEKLPTDELCKICMDAPIECVILECGHMATCTKCGKVLSECPICRQYIVRVVRFFRA